MTRVTGCSVCALALMGLAHLASAGCSDKTQGGGGSGGAGGAGGAGGSSASPQIQAFSIVSDGSDAIDAAPDPTAKNVYYLADGEQGLGLYRVGPNGESSTALVVGAPFVDPRGVVVSHDLEMVYVADRAAGGSGAIIAVSLIDLSATMLEGTVGLAPRALEVRERGDLDDIVFVGELEDGTKGVFSIPEAGGPLQEVLTTGLVDPDGVAVGQGGTVFVTDRGSMDEGLVLQIDGKKTSVLDVDLMLGTPAGVASTLGDEAVLASAVDPMKHTSQVAITFTETGMHAVFDDVIRQNHDSGGLHRAYLSNFYAWAGRTGGVYRVKVILAGDSSSVGGPGD